MSEILNYDKIYYLSANGIPNSRNALENNYGFDDERGDLIIHTNDHLFFRY